MSIRLMTWCLLLLVPMAAFAQEKGAVCKADVEKYCAQSVGEGRKQVMDCLLDHQKTISDACYDSLKQRMANQQRAHACKQDKDALCQGVQPGGGRIVNCLLDHQKDLSDACYDELSKKMKAKGTQ